MSTLPGVTTIIQDFNLGVQQPAGNTCAVVGYCASGSANSLYICNSVADVKSQVAGGEAAELAASILGQVGGTVYVVPTTTVAVPATGSVTQTYASPANLTGSVSGIPYDAYSVVLTVVSGGGATANTPTYQYSLDGGQTVSPTQIVLNGTASLTTTQMGQTGLNFIWSGAGSLTAGDTVTFTTSRPTTNGSNIATALAALAVSSSLLTPYKFAAAIGISGSGNAVNQATIATSIESSVASWTTSQVYAYAMSEAGNDTDINNVTQFNALASTRLQVCAGYEDIVSSLTSRNLVARSVIFSEAGQRQFSLPSQSSERVKTGALPGVLKLYNDQALSSTLTDARFCGLRTFRGVPGFYVARGNMLAQPGSDFSSVQNREVMDIATRTATAALTQEIGSSVTVVPTTGAITNQAATVIEDFVLSQLQNVLSGQVSAITVSVNRTNNVLATSTLLVTITITPLGTVDYITDTLEFALQTVTV